MVCPVPTVQCDVAKFPPFRLIAVNSVSLAFALIANMALLLNMARRLSFAIAQSVTIVGWFISSFLLVALVCVASSSLFRNTPAESHALSQAYYYAIIAAALYCVVSMLMIVTVVGAYRGRYAKEFQLTSSQRTLMLQTISFMVYLLLGALVYKEVEGWPYLDAVYWANFTLLTIGIGGEYVPKTHLGRSLLFPYAFGGILTVGLVIGSIRSLALERGKHKMATRFVEKKRQKVLSSVDNDERTIKIGPFKTINFSQKGLTEPQRREQEFTIMRHVQESAETRRRWTSLAISIMAALILWFIGALIFTFSEKPQGWSYFVSLYFSYTTLLTIGYGDYTPISNASKPFFVFWTLLAVPTLTILISTMGDTIIKVFSDLTLWVGSVTVLPGERSTMENVKFAMKRLRDGSLFRNQRARFEKPVGLQIASEDGQDGKFSDKGLDFLARYVEDQELEEAEEAEEQGDILERDIHFYHFLLAKELQQVMRDVDASPPRQYSYQKWAYYLRLLGQDEADASRHREARIKADRSLTNGIGKANGDDDGDSESWGWSWLGTRSPLMGNKSEAQWLLRRLTATLEREMMKMRTTKDRDHMEPPPISMSELKKKPTSSGPGKDKAP
jgi:potassium channel subfamily K